MPGSDGPAQSSKAATEGGEVKKSGISENFLIAQQSV